MRPPTRLVRPPSRLGLLLRPSSILPSLLLLRPGEPPVKLAKLDPLIVRCLGVGSKLTRLLFIALVGLDCLRTMGLSSFEVSSASSSAIVTRRAEVGVPVVNRGVDLGVPFEATFPRAGVNGDWMVLAKGRLIACCCAGVVDAGRVGGAGEAPESGVEGLRMGIEEWLDTLRRVRGGVSLRYGDGVDVESGLKL